MPAAGPTIPSKSRDGCETRSNLGPGKSVVDLGAGTGKFTKRLVETGAAAIAVEPAAAMRAKLNEMQSVRVLDGTATAIPLPDASVDAIVCAQAFHWFATREALAEMHRVLKPQGVLGLIWNAHDNSVPWVKELSDVASVYEGDVPRFRTGRWRDVFPADGFSELHEEQFTNVQTGPVEQVVVDRMLSVSFIATLPQAERDLVADKLRAIVGAERVEISVPYRTFAYTARKL